MSEYVSLAHTTYKFCQVLTPFWENESVKGAQCQTVLIHVHVTFYFVSLGKLARP